MGIKVKKAQNSEPPANRDDPKRWGNIRRFDDPDMLRFAVEDYFSRQLESNRPLTITGLAAHIKVNRMTLLNYIKEVYNYDPEIVDILRDAKMRIQAWTEEQLYSNKPVGAIFALKNNWGWVDRKEQDVTSAGENLGKSVAEGLREANQEAMQKLLKEVTNGGNSEKDKGNKG